MDPEDLLDKVVEELEGLPDHSSANMAALKELDASDVSYRYAYPIPLILHIIYP